MSKHKFEFDVDFQEVILHYLVNSNSKIPIKIIEKKLINDTYFTNIHHQIICRSLIDYVKEYGKTPQKPVLNERVTKLLRKKEYRELVVEDDQIKIKKILKKFYKKPPKDIEEIYKTIINFARFIEFTTELEKVDIMNYNNYSQIVARLDKADNLSKLIEEESKGMFLFRDVESRQADRKLGQKVFPTPFRQWNNWLNYGGFPEAAVVVLLAAAKRFKTGGLLNIAKGYAAMKKTILVIDLENGEDSLGTRLDQMFGNATTRDIMQGTVDKKLVKLFKKYRRLGAEIIIRRLPALQTHAGHVQTLIKELQEEGYNIQILICDYMDLMGNKAGDTDELKRVSEAYIEMKNVCSAEKIETMYTASHVNREGQKSEESSFNANDIAKNIDKIRHADAIYGMNQTEEEREGGIMRITITDQRHGWSNGYSLFWQNVERQTLKEFDDKEIKDYQGQLEEFEKQNRGKKHDPKAEAILKSKRESYKADV